MQTKFIRKSHCLVVEKTESAVHLNLEAPQVPFLFVPDNLYKTRKCTLFEMFFFIFIIEAYFLLSRVRIVIKLQKNSHCFTQRRCWIYRQYQLLTLLIIIYKQKLLLTSTPQCSHWHVSLHDKKHFLICAEVF